MADFDLLAQELGLSKPEPMDDIESLAAELGLTQPESTPIELPALVEPMAPAIGPPDVNEVQSLSPVPAQMESFKVSKSDFITMGQLDPRKAYKKAKDMGLSEADAFKWEAWADNESYRPETAYPELKKEALPAVGAAIRTITGMIADAPIETYEEAQSISPIPAQMESFKVSKSDFITMGQLDPRKAYKKAKNLGLPEKDAFKWEAWADTESVLDKKKEEKVMRDFGIKPLTERFIDILDPQVLREEKILRQIERLALHPTSVGKAWKSGKINFVMDQYVGDNIFAGDRAQTEKVLALRKKVQTALQENTPESKNIVTKTINSLAQMAYPMIKTGAKGMIPGVGKAIMLYDWGRQGAGEVYAELREAGVSHKTAKDIAPMAGLLYAGIEQLQFGQITNMGGIQAVKRMIIEKLLDFAKEVGEESLQRAVTDGAIEFGKQTEGLSEKGLLEIGKDLASGMGEEAKEAGPAMFVLSLFGLGGGMITHGVNPEQVVDEADATAFVDARQDIDYQKKQARSAAAAEKFLKDNNMGSVAEFKNMSEEQQDEILDSAPSEKIRDTLLNTIGLGQARARDVTAGPTPPAEPLGGTVELKDEPLGGTVELKEETAPEPGQLSTDQALVDEGTKQTDEQETEALAKELGLTKPDVETTEDSPTGQENLSALAEKAAELEARDIDPVALQKKYSTKESTVTLDKIASELRSQEKYKGATEEEIQRAAETAGTNWVTGAPGKPFRLQWEEQHKGDDNSDASDYVTFMLMGDVYKFKADNTILSHDEADAQVLRPIADIMSYYSEAIRDVVQDDAEADAKNTHDSGDEFGFMGRVRKEDFPIVAAMVGRMRDDINKLRVVSKEKGVDVPVGFAAGLVEGVDSKKAEDIMEVAKKAGRTNEISVDKSLQSVYNIVDNRVDIDDSDIKDLYEKAGMFTGRETEERRESPKTEDKQGDDLAGPQGPVGQAKGVSSVPPTEATKTKEVTPTKGIKAGEKPSKQGEKAVAPTGKKAPAPKPEVPSVVVPPQVYTTGEPSSTGMLVKPWKRGDKPSYSKAFQNLPRKKQWAQFAKEKKGVQKAISEARKVNDDARVTELKGIFDRMATEQEKYSSAAEDTKRSLDKNRKIYALTGKPSTKPFVSYDQQLRETMGNVEAENLQKWLPGSPSLKSVQAGMDAIVKGNKGNKVASQIREQLIENFYEGSGMDVNSVSEMIDRPKGVEDANIEWDDDITFFAKAPKSLDDLIKSYAARGVTITATESDGKIKVGKIVVLENLRKQGMGSETVESLTRYADETNQTIVLTPSKDFGATSVERLKKFYKRFGFVENKGRNKDYEIFESMYREPTQADTQKAKATQKLTPGKTTQIAKDFAKSLNLIPADADVQLQVVPMEGDAIGSMRENPDSGVYEIKLNENLPSSQIGRILNHEIVHIGISRVLQSDPKTVKKMQAVFKSQYESKAMNALKQKYAPEIAARKTQAQKDAYLFQEFFAANAEKALDGNRKGVAGAVWKIWKDFLTAIGVKDVDGVTRALLKAMRTAGAVEGKVGTTQLAIGQADPSMTNIANLLEEFDDEGTIDGSQETADDALDVIDGLNEDSDNPSEAISEAVRKFRDYASTDREFGYRQDTSDQADNALDEIRAIVGQTQFAVAPSVESKAFKKWFKDSKVVDANGAPLVVYHGGDSKITAFDESSPDRGHLGVAYFTSDKGIASDYSVFGAVPSKSERARVGEIKGREPAVIPAYLSITKPISPEIMRYGDLLSVFTKEELAEAYLDNEAAGDIDLLHDYDYEEDKNAALLSDIQDIVIAEKLETEDAASLSDADASFNFLYNRQLLGEYAKRTKSDGIIYEDMESGGTTYVPFKPTQIKSTSNTGEFDPADPDIYKAKADPEADKKLTDFALKQMLPSIRKAVVRTIQAETKAALRAQVENAKQKQVDTKEFQQELTGTLKKYGEQLSDENRIEWNKLVKRNLPKTTRGIEGSVKRLIQSIDKIEQRKAKQRAVKSLKKTIRGIPGNMRPEYRTQVDALMEGVDISRMTEKTRGRLHQVQKLLQDGLDLPETVTDHLKRLGQISLADMDLQDVQKLDDALQQVLAQQKLKDKLLIRGKWRQMNKYTAQARTNILKTTPAKKMRSDGTGSIDQFKPKGLADKLWNAMVGRDAETAEVIAERVDGMDIGDVEAIVGQVVFGGADQGLTDQLAHVQYVEDEYTKNFSDVNVAKYSTVSAQGAKAIRRLAEKIAVPIEVSPGKTLRLTPAHRMTIYAHTRNEHNADAILSGVYYDSALEARKTELNQAEVQKIVESMPPKEKEIVDWGMTISGGHNQKAINATSKLISGRESANVENYFRLMRKDIFKNYMTGQTSASELMQYGPKTLENSGALKQRNVNAEGAVVIEDWFTSFQDQVNFAGIYSAYAPWLRSAKQFLNDIEPTFRNTGRLDEYRALDKFVRDIEGRQMAPPLEFEKMFTGLVGKAAGGALGLNPVVITRQLASYPFLATELDNWALAEAATIVPGSQKARETVEWMRKYSPQNRARVDAGQVGLIVGARSAANETNRFFGGKSPLLDKQTAGIQKFDAMVILRAFGAAKIQVAKNTKLTGEELNQAAAKLAEKAVRRTQPMYSAVHRTAVARTKNPMIKLWTAFTSVTSQILQMYKRSNMRFSRSKKSPEDLTKWLGSMLLIWLSSSLSMVGIDELKDRAFGRIPTWAKRLTGLLKYSTSPVYFGRNVTAITSDAIKFAESGKYSTWNSDMASHNLISGMAVEAGDAARDIVMGLLEDNPFSTQDYKRIQRGTLNGVMLVMKGWTGFSGRNLINYFYKLPKKFAERVSNVGRKLKTAQNEVEYHPRTGRYKTIEGQKYKIHGRAFKEYEQNVKKYSSQMFEKAFTDETWDVLDAETKKTQLKVFFDAAKYKAYYEIPESDRIEITKEEE